MSLFNYFQPFNHDAQTGSWLNKIFAIPAGYAIQARSADGMTVTVNPGFGFDGYRVVLSGTFSFAENGAVSSGFVNRADLYGPGGLHISSAQVNTSIEALRNDQSHELHGSDGADTLSAWANTWKIEGGPGNDLLQARNWLYGPEITGGPGADTMTGQGGNEYFFTGDGADSIVGGGGYDIVLFDEAKGPLEVWLDQPAPAGHILIDNVYQIEGSKFGMTIHGGARADDVYIGGHGVDSIWGGAGDDQFHTGGGQDFVRGETGNDLLSVARPSTIFMATRATTRSGVGRAATGWSVARTMTNCTAMKTTTSSMAISARTSSTAASGTTPSAGARRMTA